MIVMSALFIEAAQDCSDFNLQHVTELEEQRKEYFSANPQASEAEYVAYATGLMVARIYLMGMPLAVKSGVKL